MQSSAKSLDHTEIGSAGQEEIVQVSIFIKTQVEFSEAIRERLQILPPRYDLKV